jgi:thiol-disulfide isomerase/thioredoxin
MVSAKETVKAYIEQNPVMVFSKSYCPYCDQTKKLLDEKSAQFDFKYKVVELDKMDGRHTDSPEPSVFTVLMLFRSQMREPQSKTPSTTYMASEAFPTFSLWGNIKKAETATSKKWAPSSISY